MTRYIAAGTKARFALTKPGEAPLTFTLTMTADEWHLLMSELPADRDKPACQTLGNMISTMLGALTARMAETYESTGWSEAEPVSKP